MPLAPSAFRQMSNEHVPLKFHMTIKLSEISKSTDILIELLYVRIYGNKYIVPLNVRLQIGKCTAQGYPYFPYVSYNV